MRSKPGLVYVAVLFVLALFPCTTQAQGRRSGIVQSPFGPLYDTRSLEWRMAGGDMMLYQQIMQQRMMLRQQQMFLKQQQLLMKQQKSGKKATQPGATLNAPATGGFGNKLQPGLTPSYRRKSRFPGTTAARASQSAEKRGSAKTSATTRKPGSASPDTSKASGASPASGTQTPEP